MNVELGEMKPGEIRKLTKQELEELYERVEKSQNAGTGRTAE